MFNNSHKSVIYIYYIVYVTFKVWLDVIMGVSSIKKSGRHTSENYFNQSAKFIQNVSCAFH
jgi:hypothetical protein